MCQVCANNGNIAEEVKVEGISGRIFVTSFSRYVVYHTSHKHVHVGTCTLNHLLNTITE